MLRTIIAAAALTLATGAHATVRYDFRSDLGTYSGTTPTFVTGADTVFPTTRSCTSAAPAVGCGAMLRPLGASGDQFYFTRNLGGGAGAGYGIDFADGAFAKAGVYTSASYNSTLTVTQLSYYKFSFSSALGGFSFFSNGIPDIGLAPSFSECSPPFAGAQCAFARLFPTGNDPDVVVFQYDYMNGGRQGRWQFANGAFTTPGTSTSIASTDGTATLTIEEIMLGATTAVPEPGSWAMLVLGIGATGGALRRRRRQGRIPVAA